MMPETHEFEDDLRKRIRALASLDIPLVTTNYDDLIEKVTKLKRVTWKDTRNAARVIAPSCTPIVREKGDRHRALRLFAISRITLHGASPLSRI
jgi:hypothetical protein